MDQYRTPKPVTYGEPPTDAYEVTPDDISRALGEMQNTVPKTLFNTLRGKIVTLAGAQVSEVYLEDQTLIFDLYDHDLSRTYVMEVYNMGFDSHRRERMHISVETDPFTTPSQRTHARRTLQPFRNKIAKWAGNRGGEWLRRN
jgi:hypothetical protein